MRELYLRKSGHVDPSYLLRRLAAMNAGENFCDGGQHDCEELLSAMMDRLHEDLVGRTDARLRTLLWPVLVLISKLMVAGQCEWCSEESPISQWHCAAGACLDILSSRAVPTCHARLRCIALHKSNTVHGQKCCVAVLQNEGSVPDSPAKLPPSTSPAGPELTPIAEANSVSEPGPGGLARPSFDSAADEALRSLRQALALSTRSGHNGCTACQRGCSLRMGRAPCPCSDESLFYALACTCLCLIRCAAAGVVVCAAKAASSDRMHVRECVAGTATTREACGPAAGGT